MKQASEYILLSGIVAVIAVALFIAPAVAGDDGSPFGTYKQVAQGTGYGAKKPVTSIKEARSALAEYFKDKDVKIGSIEEKELYFEAEILDKDGKEVVDRVIIDKRTGRIRSIY